LKDRVQIYISAGAFLLWAALLMLLPMQWVLAILVSTCVHEFFHAAAIFLCGGRVFRIVIGGRGMTMDTEFIIGFRETLCALAGPLGSFLLMFLWHRFPRVALCGAVQGMYNLLPLFPLDGGRALRSLLFSLLSPPKAKKIYTCIQCIILAILTMTCTVLVFRIGFLVIPVVFLLFRRKWQENSLAKSSFSLYNRCD
jgi:stage IV sporulation protein FB